jgi:hypothetical protein
MRKSLPSKRYLLTTLLATVFCLGACSETAEPDRTATNQVGAGADSDAKSTMLPGMHVDGFVARRSTVGSHQGASTYDLSLRITNPTGTPVLFDRIVFTLHAPGEAQKPLIAEVHFQGDRSIMVPARVASASRSATSQSSRTLREVLPSGSTFVANVQTGFLDRDSDEAGWLTVDLVRDQKPAAETVATVLPGLNIVQDSRSLRTPEEGFRVKFVLQTHLPTPSGITDQELMAAVFKAASAAGRGAVRMTDVLPRTMRVWYSPESPDRASYSADQWQYLFWARGGSFFVERSDPNNVETATSPGDSEPREWLTLEDLKRVRVDCNVAALIATVLGAEPVRSQSPPRYRLKMLRLSSGVRPVWLLPYRLQNSAVAILADTGEVVTN